MTPIMSHSYHKTYNTGDLCDKEYLFEINLKLKSRLPITYFPVAKIILKFGTAMYKSPKWFDLWNRCVIDEVTSLI